MAEEGIIVEINKKAVDQITDNIKELGNKYNNLSKEVSELWAKTFVRVARENLRIYLIDYSQRATDVSSITSNIYCIETANGWSVIVKNETPNEPNLMLFLEYGTGLRGEEHYHPQASKIGWQYAVNRDNYKFLPIEGSGWFFTDDGTKLIGGDDYKIKNRSVFSNGLVPARYIYDTKRKLDTVYALSFQRTKSGTYFDLDRFKNLLRKVN